MMLRIIFTGLATCVLLLAAGVRFAREDAPQDVREKLAAAMERAIESAKEALSRPPQPRTPAPSSLEPAPEAAASVPAPEAAASAPAPAPRPAVPPPASEPMPRPAQAAAEPPEAGLEGPREEDPGWQALPLAVEPSQDEWAGLIRRMLAIYERVGVAE
jgi:hypothetical protein